MGRSRIAFDLTLVVANRSLQPLTVDWSSRGEEDETELSGQLPLDPHETRLLDLKREYLQNRGQKLPLVGAASFEHSGKPGELLVRGLMIDRRLGFSSQVEFSDPADLRSNRFEGTGLRLGRFRDESLEPVLLVRNVSSETRTIRARIVWTEAGNEVASVELPQVRLEPGELRDLSQAVKEALAETGVESAGLEVSYDGKPGDVAVLAQSVSESADHVFPVPMLDPETLSSAAGGLPWTVADGYTTYLHFKNTTDSEQLLRFEINYPGGSFSPGLRTLKPRQTLLVDIARLTQEQTVDENGNGIP